MTHHAAGHWDVMPDGSGRIWRPDPIKASTLFECPTCLGWVSSDTHILKSIRQYHGGRDIMPEMQWCTPEGFQTLPFNEHPRGTHGN